MIIKSVCQSCTFLHREAGFYVGDVGGNDDFDGEEMDVSEWNVLGGARISRGLQCFDILELRYFQTSPVINHH